ncbi:hypothetical protein EL84_18215 [Paenibacillus sp. VT-400]|uniref:hypothetical protein n=1 Tax=Paenibacillus sp. VT-400 TaxID=1495853 RepID=UPI00064A7394|nr:hypothetical protein [Paenibacillus sp. VT-400]KLU54141.1 hypothetical protein EL84_18215 [Paenibacillus sp. VT-400]
MKHVHIVFSLLFIMVGIVIITLSKMIEEVIPKLGYAAFQSAAAGSYDSSAYQVNFELNYWIGAICILGGVICLISTMNVVRNSIRELNIRNKAFDETHNYDDTRELK